MDQPLLTANGLNGQIELYRNYVRIRRQGLRAFINFGFKGDKNIRIEQITAMQFRSADIVAGYIQFTLVGGIEGRGGRFDAEVDENSVLFGMDQEPSFAAMRDAIQDRLHFRSGSSEEDGPGRFRIDGVDRELGLDTTWYCEANSAANAKVKGELQGIVVTKVSRA